MNTRTNGAASKRGVGIKGLYGEVLKGGPFVSRFLPTQKPVDRKVFLEADLWKRLSKIAEFHDDVFTELGADEKVSRNDIIAAFLDEGAKAYWKRIGGEPEKGTRDWQNKVKQFALELAKEMKATEGSE